jgi:hypothetical protein
MQGKLKGSCWPLQEGASRQVIAERFPLQVIKYGQGIARWQEALLPLPPPYSIKYVEYHWGPPGIGKSTTITLAHPDAFIKDCNTKWWDNYKGQAKVILDDFPGQMTAVTAKHWLGEVNCPLEVKGGSTEMRYTQIFITANVPPEDCFEQAKDVNRDAFKRRLKKVFHYDWNEYAEVSAEMKALGHTRGKSVTQTKGTVSA